MSKGIQLYYNILFGALGGLLAWFILGFVKRDSVDLPPILLSLLPLGAGAGLFLGLLIGQIEGSLIEKSWRKAITGAFNGALAGVISGLVGFVLAQLIFTIIGGELIGRVLGWMCFGLLVGVSQGLVNRSAHRLFYGGAGGLAGGLFGGLVYEGITQAARNFEPIFPLAGALGMAAVGASIGAFFALFRRIGRARFDCIDGIRSGTSYYLEEETTIFGRNDRGGRGRVYIPDSGLAKEHLSVQRRKDGYYCVPQSPGSQIYIARKASGQPELVLPQGTKLENKDEIKLGNVSFQFNK